MDAQQSVRGLVARWPADMVQVQAAAAEGLMPSRDEQLEQWFELDERHLYRWISDDFNKVCGMRMRHQSKNGPRWCSGVLRFQNWPTPKLVGEIRFNLSGDARKFTIAESLRCERCGDAGRVEGGRWIEEEPVRTVEVQRARPTNGHH